MIKQIILKEEKIVTLSVRELALYAHKEAEKVAPLMFRVKAWLNREVLPCKRCIAYYIEYERIIDETGQYLFWEV